MPAGGGIPGRRSNKYDGPPIEDDEDSSLEPLERRTKKQIEDGVPSAFEIRRAAKKALQKMSDDADGQAFFEKLAKRDAGVYVNMLIQFMKMDQTYLERRKGKMNPLEFWESILNDETEPADRRMQAADKLAADEKRVKLAAMMMIRDMFGQLKAQYGGLPVTLATMRDLFDRLEAHFVKKIEEAKRNVLPE